MKSLMQSCVWMGVAVLATAVVGVTAAAENPSDNLQASWNDYPAKWIGNSEIPMVTPSPNETPPSTNYQPEQPQTPIPPAHWFPPQTPPGEYPPGLIPPRQQQQGKPSGGSFGGKQGGSFGWGKTKPPQSQQGAYPRPGGGQANPNQAELLEYVRLLQQQNALLLALVKELGGQLNGERSTDMPSGGMPLNP